MMRVDIYNKYFTFKLSDRISKNCREYITYICYGMSYECDVTLMMNIHYEYYVIVFVIN